MNDAPPPVPSVEVPQVAPQPRLRPGPIVRDIAIVFLLTALGGFVIGIATGGPSQDSQRFMLAIAASNLLLGIVGFTIAGCLAPPARWEHLGVVAFGVWLAGLINVAFFGVTLTQWMGSAILAAVIMGAGGALSYAFKRDRQPPA
jgi:hypothetical protein